MVSKLEHGLLNFSGIASCRYCFTTVDFAKGIGPLISYSESNKHRPKESCIKSTTSQLTIEETLGDGIENVSKQCEEKKKVESLDLDITRSLSRHGIPFEYVN